MKLFLLKADVGGSGTYRVEEPARALSALHPELEFTIATDIDVDGVRFEDGRVRVDTVRSDVDVLVSQRPMTQQISEVLRVARLQGIRIVVDIDDDFHNVHPANAAAASTDPKVSPWHNRLWLNRSLSYADVVTVSTPALKKYGNEINGPYPIVIRNYIPERATHVRSRLGGDTIGWTGTLQTHPTDMERARGALNKTDAPFVVVGDPTNVARSLGVPDDRVKVGSPWVEGIDQYWQAVADSVAVGIAPLEPSKFNKAKSWLKPAEYCALGIPFVVSPTPEYRQIVTESGAGVTAASQNRWADGVAMMLDRRAEYAAAARAWARANTLEQHADEWLAAWERAANR